MTANIRNTISSLTILERQLEIYRDAPEKMTSGELQRAARDLHSLLNSSRKCIESLYAQLKFLEGAANHGRALIDENGAVVSGMAVETLHVPIDGTERDVVIYGRADALAYVAAVLDAKGLQSNGPAPLEILAQDLAENPVSELNGGHHDHRKETSPVPHRSFWPRS